MVKRYRALIDAVAKRKPLVHCITNHVTIQSCANMLLACGASPIMADDPNEAAEVTAIANALVLNTGTLNENRLSAMLIAGKQANERDIPVLLDPVGVGISSFRKEAVMKLLQHVRFSVIRGNLSEICFLCDRTASSRGVDALKTSDALSKAICCGKQLAGKTGAVVAVSGETDCITDGEKTILIQNGSSQMARITGSGCMLSCLLGAYIGAAPKAVLDAVTAGVLLYDIAGELAANRTEQIGSFGTALFDAVDLLHDEKEYGIIERRAILEEI